MDKGVPMAPQGAKSEEVRSWNTFKDFIYCDLKPKVMDLLMHI